ncbi:MAG: glycosyltransferase [Nitrososphaeria archaeon]
MNKRSLRVVMITVNDTQNPKTGGEYVYKVIKDELIRHKYLFREVSVPILLKSVLKKDKGKIREDLYRMALHFLCIPYSLFERLGSNVVITSSHPAFPVFGHLVYHQPKTGTGAQVGKEYISILRRVGWWFVEKEWLSPVWLLAKRSHLVHLSNSNFTRRLIKELYGLDSLVLYPPVPIAPYLRKGLKNERKYAVLIAKPEVPSGIVLLPKIVKNIPKVVKFYVIGKADFTGLKIIQNLRKKGFNIEYLGYVSEQEKIKLMQTCSHYLHLGLNETFGITVVEAMAAGCVPIAPNSGGMPEYLPKDLLYNDANEAAEKIVNKIAINDFDFKLKLREIARNFSEEKFRTRFMGYFKMLENLLKIGEI